VLFNLLCARVVAGDEDRQIQSRVLTVSHPTHSNVDRFRAVPMAPKAPLATQNASRKSWGGKNKEIGEKGKI